MNRATCLAAAALVFTAPSAASAADLVTNGGFETGDFSGWTLVNNTDGATIVTTPVGIGIPGQEGPPTAEGNFYAYLGPYLGTGSLTQSLATVAGLTYRVSFQLFNAYPYDDDGNPIEDIGVAFFTANFGAVQLADLSGPQGSEGGTSFENPYTSYSFDVDATSNSTALNFTFRQDPSGYFLDAVSVAAVPEPSTWALMLAGFGLTGLVMRRRRQRVAFA